MSQFNYINEINSILTMDGELNGPAPRWQRKLLESSSSTNNAAPLNGSLNTSKLSVSILKSHSLNYDSEPVWFH